MQIINNFLNNIQRSIIKLLALLILGFILFFGNIQQVNSLSIQNNKTRLLTNEQKKKNTEKEFILSQNTTMIIQEIDKKLATGDIQNTLIGENIKLPELEKILKKQQNTNKNNNQTNTFIVAR